jgi:hypothetical protein
MILFIIVKTGEHYKVSKNSRETGVLYIFTLDLGSQKSTLFCYFWDKKVIYSLFVKGKKWWPKAVNHLVWGNTITIRRQISWFLVYCLFSSIELASSGFLLWKVISKGSYSKLKNIQNYSLFSSDEGCYDLFCRTGAPGLQISTNALISLNSPVFIDSRSIGDGGALEIV